MIRSPQVCYCLNPLVARVLRLHDPRVTYKALLALVAACGLQFGTLVMLVPMVRVVFGDGWAHLVNEFATKGAAACSLLVALLGWITAAGRSIVTAVDNPQSVDTKAGDGAATTGGVVKPP